MYQKKAVTLRGFRYARMSTKAFTHEEEQIINTAFEDVVSAYLERQHRGMDITGASEMDDKTSENVELIHRAFTFANQAHYGVRRL